MSDQTLKRTPLFEQHVALGGKIVPFAGWELPVQYSGIVAEHHAVRTAAGLFDVSHMGEIWVSGPEAEAALDSLTCNRVTGLVDGKAQYSAILNEEGGVVDDIIIYRYSPTRYLVCVNASNTDKDYKWFTSHNRHNATFDNRSSEFGQIALQGPQAEKIMVASSSSGQALARLRPFQFAEIELFGVPVIAARTGYTGEDGFEFFTPWTETPKVWQRLLEIGGSFGLVPAGLGARDSLRLEACYPLHGHELADDISAVESGLSWIIKPAAKGEFIGRSIVEREMREGAKRTLVGIVLDDPGITRGGDAVYVGGRKVGVVTSGTKTPTVNRSVALALVDREAGTVGTTAECEVRGKRLQGHVVEKPFYKRES